MVPQPPWYPPLVPLGTLSGGNNNTNHFLGTYGVRHKLFFLELVVLHGPRLLSALPAESQ